ncbi:MAG: hypothetical protein EXR45_01090 [Chloroflexi bacterium]|nr:hypothetical protein [Chloroflexota bacterium]
MTDDFPTLPRASGDTPIGPNARIPIRPPGPQQRLRDAKHDRRLELASASIGLGLALVCTAIGISTTVMGFEFPETRIVAILGLIATIGGIGLAFRFMHGVIVAVRTSSDPSPGTATTHCPTITQRKSSTQAELRVASGFIGIGCGIATGLDLGTLILLVAGRTLWDIAPTTSLILLVILPMVGIFPVALLIIASDRRRWLRPQVFITTLAWVAGTALGFVGSGVVPHLGIV